MNEKEILIGYSMFKIGAAVVLFMWILWTQMTIGYLMDRVDCLAEGRTPVADYCLKDD